MSPADFIAEIAGMAVADMRRSRVLASITISQAALESSWGQYAPGNNLFGIKGTGQEVVTQEYENGHFVTVTDGFRVYDSWAGSVQDHSDFLTVNGRYAAAGFFEACAGLDYRAAALSLQAAGYATDPYYAQKLIQIIESFGLTAYDKEGANGMNAEDAQELVDLLQGMWALFDKIGTQDAKDKVHRLAGVVRQAGGLPQDG